MNYMVRFGSEVNANPESLAEHSYMVLMLAIQIAKQYQLDIGFERLVSIAMLHDVSEIMTSDIPTPLKNTAVKKESDELENDAVDIIKDKWQLWIGDLESYNYKDLDNLESRIVKAADYISAIVYAVEEAYIGNKSMAVVRDRSMVNFRKWVRLDWEREIFYQLEDWIREL
jgi:5'-deoxynucleotidase